MQKSTIDAMKDMIELNETVIKFDIESPTPNTTGIVYHDVNGKELIFFIEDSYTTGYHGTMVSFDLDDDKFEEKFMNFREKYQLSLDRVMDSVLSL